MKLEYANLTCPKCGNGNYMRHLVGKNVGELNVKCINCNSYFKLSDFYRMAGKAEAYTMTNADRLRAMSDEELADWVWGAETAGRAYGPWGKKAWLDWLRQEAKE